MSDVKPAINPWFIAVTVTLATFMELLDTSIANVALPYIGGGLGHRNNPPNCPPTSVLLVLKLKFYTKIFAL